LKKAALHGAFARTPRAFIFVRFGTIISSRSPSASAVKPSHRLPTIFLSSLFGRSIGGGWDGDVGGRAPLAPLVPKGGHERIRTTNQVWGRRTWRTTNHSYRKWFVRVRLPRRHARLLPWRTCSLVRRKGSLFAKRVRLLVECAMRWAPGSLVARGGRQERRAAG
jgi:hypothetical protein